MQTRFDLTQADIPKQWYNLNADFPEPLPPPLHPGTKQPITPDMLGAIFPENLIQQEISTERWIEIPEPVRDIYALWRPTPLLRAVRFEQALQTPAHIYYKYEGASPAGSHKVNTSVPQAYFNKVAGTKRLATETGAGQWGASLALYGAYDLKYPAALNGPQFLAGSILKEPLKVVNGEISVPNTPGLGVEVDESKLGDGQES